MCSSDLPADRGATELTKETLQNLSLEDEGGLTAEARTNLLSANATFRTSLQQDPDNSAANFGLAMTSLALRADDMAQTFRNMNKNGLSIGGDDAGSIFRESPLEISESPALSARALAVPEKSATIRQLQDSLELKFLPTVDSLANALQKCWNDPGFAYRFKLDGIKDSIGIGRADVGVALVAVQAVQNYLVWLIAQDVEAGFAGQGFGSQYAWLDTLSHIEMDVGPASAMQKQAFENLKVLFPATGVSSTRNFLGIRAGYQSKVDAIPGRVIQMANTLKAAADYSTAYQTSLSKGILQLDADQNKAAHEAADSLVRLLSGPTTFTKEGEYREEYAGFVGLPDASGGLAYQTQYKTVYYPGFSVKVDLAKVITLGSRQVFFPRFQWNDAAQWSTKGPFSLVKGAVSTSMKDLDDLDPEGPLDMEPYMEWPDPTFGGIFPAFKTTKDVLAKMQEMDPEGTVVAPSSQFLPRRAGF